MLSFKSLSDYQQFARAYTASTLNVIACENCDHDMFLRVATEARLCRPDRFGTLHVGPVDHDQTGIEFQCENCGLEHKDWQFREIQW